MLSCSVINDYFIFSFLAISVTPNTISSLFIIPLLSLTMYVFDLCLWSFKCLSFLISTTIFVYSYRDVLFSFTCLAGVPSGWTEFFLSCIVLRCLPHCVAIGLVSVAASLVWFH